LGEGHSRHDFAFTDFGFQIACGVQFGSLLR
jgi:hypothetical protein